MSDKFCCVIDSTGRYVTYVYVLGDEIQNYKLKEGERFIDAKLPVRRAYAGQDGFVKPIWDGTWVEGATKEEITEWEAANQKPEDYVTPTQLDRVEAQATYTAMMTDTLLEG